MAARAECRTVTSTFEPSDPHASPSPTLPIQAWIREYATIVPLSLPDALRLYSCLLLAGLSRLLSPHQFKGSGRYLIGTKPIRVRRGGLNFFVRPNSEDLLYTLSLNKPTVAKWFRPLAGDVVVDAGAHTGLYSLIALRAGAKVLAIEPNPNAAELIYRNARANGLENIQVIQAALGPAKGQAWLQIPGGWDGKASVVPGWVGIPPPGTTVRKVMVRVETLDSATAAIKDDQIDWLLIDVEGSELEALRGGKDALGRTRNLIIEVSDKTYRECRIILEEGLSFRILAEERQSAHTGYVVASR